MLRDILSFYRVNNWIKSVGFSILGLSLLTINPFLLFLGLIQASFLFSFLFSFNDFFDYVKNKEKNFIGNLIKNNTISKTSALSLCLLPLILSIIPLVLNFSNRYFTVYLSFFIISILYSLPKFRLRNIPIIDVICNILFFYLIFLQSYFFYNSTINPKIYFFLFWIILYIFSHEILHQISHFEKDKKVRRLTTVILLGKESSIKLFKFSFILPIIYGTFVIFSFPTFRIFVSIMILSSFIRLIYVRNLNKRSDFEKLRNRLGGILEGGLYFILNILVH